MSTSPEPIDADDWGYIQRQLHTAELALRRAQDTIEGRRDYMGPVGYSLERCLVRRQAAIGTWLTLQHAQQQEGYSVWHARTEAEGRALGETGALEPFDTEAT